VLHGIECIECTPFLPSLSVCHTLRRHMLPHRSLRFPLAVFLLASYSYAKDPPVQVIVWPDTGTPVLRFTLRSSKKSAALGISARAYEAAREDFKAVSSEEVSAACGSNPARVYWFERTFE
jgi:hypothetical protein